MVEAVWVFTGHCESFCGSLHNSVYVTCKLELHRFKAQQGLLQLTLENCFSVVFDGGKPNWWWARLYWFDSLCFLGPRATWPTYSHVLFFACGCLWLFSCQRYRSLHKCIMFRHLEGEQTALPLLLKFNGSNTLPNIILPMQIFIPYFSIFWNWKLNSNWVQL